MAINYDAEITLNDWSEEDYEVDVSKLVAGRERSGANASGSSMSATMESLGIYL